jgi:hypothetical protein
MSSDSKVTLWKRDPKTGKRTSSAGVDKGDSVGGKGERAKRDPIVSFERRGKTETAKIPKTGSISEALNLGNQTQAYQVFNDLNRQINANIDNPERYQFLLQTRRRLGAEWGPNSGMKQLKDGSMWVIKDKQGKYRWVSISSNSYEDREGEIVSQKALETAVNRGDLGNLHWWHDNGAVIGSTDFQMMHGKMLIESGTFKSEKIGAAFAGKKGLGVSVGFLHPPTEPTDGIYHNIRIVERSVLPAKKAANGLTRFSAT